MTTIRTYMLYYKTAWKKLVNNIWRNKLCQHNAATDNSSDIIAYGAEWTVVKQQTVTMEQSPILILAI